MKILGYLRIPVSIALFALVIRFVKPASLLENVGNAAPGIIAAAFGIVVCGHLIRIAKWEVLTRPFELNVSHGRLALYYLYGLFFNLLLPGNVGGDAVKGLALGSHVGNRVTALTSVIVDRFTGLLAVLLISTGALLTNIDRIADKRICLILAFFWTCVLAVLFVVFRTGTGGRIGVVKRFREAAKRYREHKTSVAAALLAAFAFQIVAVLNNYMVASSIGVPNADIADFFAMLPIAFVVAMLPISIGGLGAREWAYWFLFTGVLGYPEAAMVTVSILIFTCEVILAIIGGIAYAFAPKRKTNET